MIQAKCNLSKFIIDEAECLSSQSIKFKNAYLKLGVIRKKFLGIPIVALTSGAAEQVNKINVFENELKF